MREEGCCKDLLENMSDEDVALLAADLMKGASKRSKKRFPVLNGRPIAVKRIKQYLSDLRAGKLQHRSNEEQQIRDILRIVCAVCKAMQEAVCPYV